MDVILFEKCIKYISKRFDVRLIEDVKQSAFPPSHGHNKNIATISFDDGYKDNIEYAVPILDRYNITASFYVVTDCIEHNRLTWTHILEHAFLNTSHTFIKLDLSFLPVDLRYRKLLKPSDRIIYVNQLKQYLRTTAHQNRQEVVTTVSNIFDDVSYPELMMNWNDLDELKSKGHYIGSHTLSHAVLNTINDSEIIKNELYLSGKAIEKHLGYFPVSISYPLGKYNKKVIDLCKESGYNMGLAVEQKPYITSSHSDFEIPRMELYNEKWWKTWLRLNNNIERIKRLL